MQPRQRSAQEVIRRVATINAEPAVSFNLSALGEDKINLAEVRFGEIRGHINRLLDTLSKNKTETPRDILTALVRQSTRFPFNYQLEIIEAASAHQLLALPETRSVSPIPFFSDATEKPQKQPEQTNTQGYKRY